jgi:hypothetical protein
MSPTAAITAAAQISGWRCQPQLPASLPAWVLASAASAQQPYSAVSAVTVARSDEVQRMTQYLSSDLVPGGLRTVSCGFCPNLPGAVRLYTVDCVLRVSCATLHGLLGCGLLTGQMAARCYGVGITSAVCQVLK